ncbi:unnamed protein product [Vitrella brassicaformis CCMP3155]|uniref:inorganic diphosphatase n=2 Tax=Vitrella brassicaformis TaxID=1169539 RepID=A0A0G4EP04_VITBC|nr:unnamed protein product [Vitrella brassicaformis CCMP3155]|eukprot:CEL99540.1 unnamed protein product [Vitrella brassicaformis CCMP3155]
MRTLSRPLLFCCFTVFPHGGSRYAGSLLSHARPLTAFAAPISPSSPSTVGANIGHHSHGHSYYHRPFSTVAAALPSSMVVGQTDTEEFRVVFKDEEGRKVSPWHDVPLQADGKGLYHFITEIPRLSKAKMEVDTKDEFNPIKQDIKKGKLRYYHGPIFWNYGCFPQTWEDPNERGGKEVDESFGDNDPLDVVEVGQEPLEMGSVTPVKVLGALSMIDDGELDWKIIAIKVSDPHFDSIDSLEDLEKFYPHTIAGIREWFRWYKVPDGKPLNSFGHDGQAINKTAAEKVISETNEAYKRLLKGEVAKGKLWIRVKTPDAAG